MKPPRASNSKGSGALEPTPSLAPDPERRRFLLVGASLGLAVACRLTPAADEPRTASDARASEATGEGAALDGSHSARDGSASRPGEAAGEFESSPGARVDGGATSPASEPVLEPQLPVPDLREDAIVRTVAGIRPYRRGGPRIELEAFGDKLVVHDYGHGGGGITLSWGSAAEVLDLLAQVAPRPEPLAVIGAGVQGLSCALLAARAGFVVRVLARDFPPHTTSDVAGGQWSPSWVGAPADERYRRLLRRSHAGFAEWAGDEWGVHSVWNYTARGAGRTLQSLPRDLVPLRECARLPFPGPARAGRAYRTWLVETPRYLARLVQELRARGVLLQERAFARRDELHALPERLIVDATGLGARELFDDARLVGVRGQLVHLPPVGGRYMLSADGYLFARGDACVLGGTFERGVEDAHPEPAACRRILARHRGFFGSV